MKNSFLIINIFFFFVTLSSFGEDFLFETQEKTDAELTAEIREQKRQERNKIYLIFEKKVIKMSKENLLNEALTLKEENLRRNEIISILEVNIEKERARAMFLIGILKLCKKGARFHIDSIRSNPLNLANNIDDMAQQDIKNGNINYLLDFEGSVDYKAHKKYVNFMREKYNVNILILNHSFEPPKYLRRLCKIYNTPISTFLGKKYGKDFLSKTRKEFEGD